MGLFECTTILHNLLMDCEDDIPDAWIVKLAEGITGRMMIMVEQTWMPMEMKTSIVMKMCIEQS